MNITQVLKLLPAHEPTPNFPVLQKMAKLGSVNRDFSQFDNVQKYWTEWDLLQKHFENQDRLKAFENQLKKFK